MAISITQWSMISENNINYRYLIKITMLNINDKNKPITTLDYTITT